MCFTKEFRMVLRIYKAEVNLRVLQVEDYKIPIGGSNNHKRMLNTKCVAAVRKLLHPSWVLLSQIPIPEKNSTLLNLPLLQ